MDGMIQAAGAVARVVLIGAGAAALLAGTATATTHRPSATLVLRVDAGIGGVRVGERQQDVLAALGSGVARPGADGLGSCSGGVCRAYRVASAIVAVDFLGCGRIVTLICSHSRTVSAVGTRSSTLIVNGHRVSTGFVVLRGDLPGWRALRCIGQPTSWMLVHSRSRAGPTTTLLFVRDRFSQAWVTTASPPNGCAMASLR
jgi:hypothetical protein